MPTLVNKAKSSSTTLLVVQDSHGAVFGALITEQLKIGEKEKYYGNGTIVVWSFVSGELKVKFSLFHLFFLLVLSFFEEFRAIISARGSN